MARRTVREGRRYREWILGEKLGTGGNGLVFAATRGDEIGAIKILRRTGAAPRLRFADEITAMRRCADIPGVLPILDSCDLADVSLESLWFVMGRATPIRVALSQSLTLRKTVEVARDVAITLAAMHDRGISHRDIKPENLFLYRDRWSVGDFGLAEFEGKLHETEVGERIGPIYYIAPEMLNSAATSSGMPADVFSLAKTLWVLATGQSFPLPGQYVPSQDAFRINSYVVEGRTSSLDALVAACTSVDPHSRPGMQKLREELDAWLSPTPIPAPPIALDISAFKTRLEARTADAWALREQERQSQVLIQRSGQRLRERLRPLGTDIERSLKEVGLESVTVTLDNLEWGLEVGASIPAAMRSRGVGLSLAVHASSVFPEVSLNCRYLVRVTGDSPAEFLAWHKELKYMPEGPSEDATLRDLDRTVRDQLQMVANLALEVGFEAPSETRGPSAQYVTLHDSSGSAVDGASVCLIANNGLFCKEVTNHVGEASFMNFPYVPCTAFITHLRYPALIEEKKDPILRAEVKSSDVVRGSFIATAGWTPVPGLGASLSFIHDAQGRRYVYGDNVAINDGQAQPVPVTLGTKLSLRSREGAHLKILPKAFRGSCFVFDIYPGE